MSVTASSPQEICSAAATSARSIATLSTQQRNDALTAVHEALASAKDHILAANAMDVTYAEKANSEGKLSKSILKRLDLSGKWNDMLQGILDVRDLPDPGK